MPYASAIPGVIGGGAGPFANAIPIILVDASGNAVTLPAAGTYGDANNVPQITVGASGIITSITNVAIAGGSPSSISQAGGTVDVDATGEVEITPFAGTSVDVALSAGGTFNIAGGPILAPDGVITAPSYAFTSTTNTGMWWDGTFLTLGQNGSSTVQIRSTQFNIKGGVNCNIGDLTNFLLATTNGTKWGTAATQKMSFWGAATVVQPVRGVTATNNVAATGTTDQFDDFTNGTVYATDYAALHATISQLCRIVRIHDVNLRAAGLMS